MKKHLLILMVLILLSGAFTLSAHAQNGAHKLVARIPFAFNVGNKNLPAGKYTITVLNPTSDRKILQIRNANGRSTAMILTTSVIGNTSEDAKLVFQRYGDRYFFAKAQMAGDATSLAAVKSNAERTEQQALAAGGKQSFVVVITE